MAENTQLVKMPNGDVVAFPSDMPSDEIHALIVHKFPKETAAYGTNAPGNGGTSNPDDPYFQGLPLPDRPDPAHTVQPGEVNTGFLAPVSHNRRTGEWAPAVPGALTGIRDSLVDAASLPGDVLSGKYDQQLDPRSGMQNLQPDLIGRGLNAATVVGADAVPAAALRLSQKGAALRAPGAAEAAGFGIPLTKGQAAGDLQQVTKEELLRNGGGSAQNVMRNFDAAQQEKIGNVASGIGSTLGKNPESTRDLVTTAIQDKVAFHKDQAASLYKIAADGGVSIQPEMVDALPQVISHSLENANVVLDSTGGLTPGANMAQKIISEDAANLTSGMSDLSAQPGSIKGTGGITLEGIEQTRKKLVGIEGVNSTDSRAVKAIKTAFDDWVQTAVDNMLVSGDESALDALKQARSASKDYLSITNPKEGDQIGLAVKKLQSMDNGGATSEEVANYLYGANVVSPTLNAPKVAARIKDIVGADSDAWKAVRADAWNRITKDLATDDPRSATMMAKRIEGFLNDKGTSLSKVLYSDDERAQMQAFADALKATITPRDATNPSRTAYTIGQMAGNISRVLAGVVTGGATGNPMLGLATTLSIPVFKNIGARKNALKAVSQDVAAPAALNTSGPANALRGMASGASGNKVERMKQLPLGGGEVTTNRLVA